MKLQIAAHGGWRNVLDFEPALLTEIKMAVIPLARITVTTWRVTINGIEAVSYLSGPTFKWKP